MDSGGTWCWIPIGSSKLKLRLLAVFLGLTLVFLVVHDVPLGFHLARVERDRIYTATERDAFTIAGKVTDALTPAALGTPQSDALMRWAIDSYLVVGEAKVVIVDGSGYLAASSDPNDTIGSDFTNRPEIADSLLGNPTSGARVSETLGGHIVYVAVPVLSGANVRGVVRLTLAESIVDNRVRSRVIGIAIAALMTIVAATVAAFVSASAIARPIKRLEKRTQELAEGDLSVRAEAIGPPEIRELAESFNEMADRLGAFIQQQKAFAGDASHQLRTPLTALRLRLEQAGAEIGKDPDSATVNIDAAMGEADRLRRLIEQLLQLARSDGMQLPSARVDVSELVRERVEAWTALAEERGDSLVADIASGVVTDTVAEAIEQIVDNFIDNAIEYTPTGTAITVSLQREDNKAVITVRDTGLGMSESARGRAFDRFWRGAEASSRPEGTGLGLAIVQQLADAIGAHCELKANEPRGLCAVLTLPIEAS